MRYSLDGNTGLQARVSDYLKTYEVLNKLHAQNSPGCSRSLLAFMKHENARVGLYLLAEGRRDVDYLEKADKARMFG